MTIKIYVASLEAYNQGRMVGGWVTPSDYEDYDKFRWAIMDATKNADEVAVHDYDGINLSNEYPNFKQLYEFCKALKDSWLDDEVILAYAGNIWRLESELTPELIADAEGSYIGTYSSFQECADQWADAQLENTDDFLRNYFDYEGYARDIEGDYAVCDVSNYNVAVFSNY